MAQTVKTPPAIQETLVQTLVGRIPWSRKWLPTPAFLHGESHGERSLAGYSPWGHKELDTTEQLTLHFSYQLWGFKCFLTRPTKTFWNRLSYFILCGCLFVCLFLIYNIVNQLYFNVKKKVNVRVSQVLHLCLLLLPDSSAGKESTWNAGDLGSIPGLDLPGLGRSPGEGKGFPL